MELYKTLRKWRMGEPGTGGRKKGELERSKRHITHKIRETWRKWKKWRKSIQGISQRRNRKTESLWLEKGSGCLF